MVPALERGDTPDLEYIIRPGGTGNIPNALIIGCQTGINF
jgi:hypothetical protein